MDQSVEYQRAVEILKKFEFSLAAIDALSLKNYKDSIKDIEAYFKKCMIELEARKSALIAEVEEKLQTQKERVANQRIVLRNLISSWNKIAASASKNFATSKDTSLELLKSTEILARSQAIDDVPSFSVNFPSDISDKIRRVGIVQEFHPLAESVKTIAGQAGSRGNENKKGTEARMNDITGICLNPVDGYLYFSDCGNKVIRKVSPEGEVAPFAGAPDGPFKAPYGIAYYLKGNVFFVADRDSHVIHRITSNGVIDVFAGLPGTHGNKDGKGGEARFTNPLGVAVDQDTGEVFVSDKGNNVIRVINQDTQVVTTLAGSGAQDRRDGNVKDACFNRPSQIFFCHPLQTLYVCEYGSNQIRILNTKSKEVTTPFDSGGSVNDRTGIVVLPNNAILLTNGNQVFHFSQVNGVWKKTLVAGNESNKGEDGPAERCNFRTPGPIIFDEKSKSCFVADQCAIRKFTLKI